MPGPQGNALDCDYADEARSTATTTSIRTPEYPGNMVNGGLSVGGSRYPASVSESVSDHRHHFLYSVDSVRLLRVCLIGTPFFFFLSPPRTMKSYSTSTSIDSVSEIGQVTSSASTRPAADPPPIRIRLDTILSSVP